jgi:hypothetical protein
MTQFHSPLEVLQSDNSYLSLEVRDVIEAEVEELEWIEREREQGGSWAENLGPVVD